MPQNQCALQCWALSPAYSDSRPLMQESLKCPGLALGPETAPVPVPAACRAGSLTQPCPASALLHVRDGWLCPALPSSACCPCCCSSHHHLWPPLPLTLPLVFFSFLQTRQATKVLNPTRVPKASPPATTMPSSGTSTRVARSPANCHWLVCKWAVPPTLHAMAPSTLSLPRVAGDNSSTRPPTGQHVLPFHSRTSVPD